MSTHKGLKMLNTEIPTFIGEPIEVNCKLECGVNAIVNTTRCYFSNSGKIDIKVSIWWDSIDIGSATCLAVDPNANITSMVEDMILKSATEFEKKLDSLVSKIKMLKGQNDTNKPIGTLYFETDFDFSVKLDGSLYSDSEFSINIYDIDAIKRIKCYGGFGSCIESKFDPHISDLLDAVVKDPTEIHSALGGNRGAMWYPQPVNVPKI